MVNTSLFGGAAIIGVLAAFWQKIRNVIHRLLSVFIVSIEVEGFMAKSIKMYCWDNLKRSPFGDRSYSSKNEYVKPVSRFQAIGYEEIGKDPIIFWNGLKPLLLGLKSNSNGKEHISEQSITLTYLRGLWNIDNLLIDCLDLYNKRSEHSKKIKRFYIRKVFGVGSSPNGRNDGQDVASVEENDHISIGDKRLLKWTFDDLGIESTNGTALGNLFFPEEINDIIKEMNYWVKSEEWYKRKNIPWKRGWLLYGQPGTGKTALVRAISEDLDLPIWVYDLSTLTNEELVRSWRRMLNSVPCVALIEDLDTVFNKRENITGTGAMRDKLTFDCVLNCIDGVERSDGVFTILTTNLIETLDPAIGLPIDGNESYSTRPGRIDRVVELKQMDEKCRLIFAKKILKEYPDEIEPVVIIGKGDTGAQFQDRCAKIALNRYWTE